MNTSASRRYIHTATPLSPSEVRDISRKECFWLGKGPDGKFLIESDHQLRKILTLYTNQQLEIMYEALVDQQSADTSSPDTWNARIEVVETFMDSSWAGIDTSWGENWHRFISKEECLPLAWRIDLTRLKKVIKSLRKQRSMKSLRRHTGALRLLDDRIDGIESILRGRRSEKENLPSSSIDLDAGADSIHTVRKAWCMWAWLHKNYDAFDKMKPFCLEYGQFLKTIEALPIDALVDIRGFLLDHMPPKDKNPWMRANRLQPLELYLSGAWASFHERDDRPWADEVWFLSIVKRIDTGRIDMAIGFLEEYLKKASSSRKPIVMRRLRALNDTRKALEITPASVSSAISDCTSRVLNAR